MLLWAMHPTFVPRLLEQSRPTGLSMLRGGERGGQWIPTLINSVIFTIETLTGRGLQTIVPALYQEQLQKCKCSQFAPDPLSHSKGGAWQCVLTSLPSDSDAGPSSGTAALRRIFLPNASYTHKGVIEMFLRIAQR